MGKLGGTPFFEIFPELDSFVEVFPLRRFGASKEEEDKRLVFFPAVDPVAWAIVNPQFVDSIEILEVSHIALAQKSKALLDDVDCLQVLEGIDPFYKR